MERDTNIKILVKINQLNTRVDELMRDGSAMTLHANERDDYLDTVLRIDTLNNVIAKLKELL